jgi:hypothetical protein
MNRTLHKYRRRKREDIKKDWVCVSKLRGYFTTLMTGIYQREKNEKLWKEISFTGWAEK